jgi:hypothetical protein
VGSRRRARNLDFRACSWDALVLLGVVATMILVPLRVGFKIHYVWVEAVLDAVFVLDVLLNFETGTVGADRLFSPRRYFVGSDGTCKLVE